MAAVINLKKPVLANCPVLVPWPGWLVVWVQSYRNQSALESVPNHRHSSRVKSWSRYCFWSSNWATMETSFASPSSWSSVLERNYWLLLTDAGVISVFLMLISCQLYLRSNNATARTNKGATNMDANTRESAWVWIDKAPRLAVGGWRV